VTDPSGQEVDIKAALNAPLLPAEATEDDAEAQAEAEVMAEAETDAAEASAAEDDAEA
jgi:hypothetical protein